MAVSRRGVVLSTLAASALAFAQLAPVGTAASLPTATAIGSVSVFSDVVPPAGSPNKPTAIVVQGQSFSVTVSFVDASGAPTPPSYNRDTTVTLSVTPATAVLSGVKKLVVPAGQSSATASLLTLTPAQNRLAITATVTAGPKTALEIAPKSSAEFDLLDHVALTKNSGDNFLNSDGTVGPCVPTRDAPQCADLYLPLGSGVGGALLSLGRCDVVVACDANRSVVQMLAGLPGYSRTTPATLVLKCDKSACAGGGVSSYVPKVSLLATGALAPASACAAKGVVNAGADYCVDYVQSKRDGAGDLLMFVLFAVDSRGSCC